MVICLTCGDSFVGVAGRLGVGGLGFGDVVVVGDGEVVRVVFFLDGQTGWSTLSFLGESLFFEVADVFLGDHSDWLGAIPNDVTDLSTSVTNSGGHVECSSRGRGGSGTWLFWWGKPSTGWRITRFGG